MSSETKQKLFIITKAIFLYKAFLTLFLVACFFHTATAAEGPISFYISRDGKDTWSGRLSEPNKDRSDGPFATLTRARDAISEMKKSAGLPEGQVSVWILNGSYYLTESFELTSEDSGTEKTQIAYQTAPYEQVNIIGGRQINEWRKVTDQTVLKRLNPAANGKVYQSDLKAQGIDNFGQFRSRGFGRSASPAALELFFQDKPMTVARWPNSDFLKITGYTEAVGDDHGGSLGKLTGGFNYEADRPSRWKDTNDIWVHGYWAYDWANSYEHIQSIDVNNHLIKTSPPYGNYGFRKGGRFYFLNILEELDEPSEFYLDRKNGILYFWPPSPIEECKALVSIVEKPLININGASYITIRGLTIECARGDGVRISGGSKNVVTDCTLRNLGNNGVTVSGGNYHGVFDCDIYQTGDGGISLSGGDRKTLLPAGHYAYKNHIHNVARWSRCYAPAISVNGVGISVSNNLIHDHPHCAILFGGNEHHIESNEIHHVCMETGDVGAIYTGRDYTYRGNIIRYNFIHHTGGVGMGSMGIYMDDCVSGTQIYGNILWKLHRAVFIGGGRDFTIENNIFVDCDPAIEIDGRGLSKAPVWHDMVYQTMKKHLEDMNWKQPPYSVRYPQLADLERFYAADDGVPPGNISILRNICVGSELLKTTWGAAKDMIVVGDNLVGQDPNFIDAANGDFRLKDDSPVFKLGFKPLFTDQIGLKRPPRSVRKGPPEVEKQDYKQDIARIKALEKSFRPGPVNNLTEYEKFADEIQSKWGQKNKEYYARLMWEACKPLSSGRFSDERQYDVARRYALSALAEPNGIPIEIELELTGHVMTDTVTPRSPKGQEWTQRRKKDVEIRFHAWKRLKDAIDPNWDPNEELWSPNAVAASMGFPGTIEPESIKDPNLRAEYETAIERNKQKIEKYTEQSRLHKWLERYPKRAEEYIVQAYSRPPFNLEELKQYLDKYIADTKTKARILDAVTKNMEKETRKEPTAP